MPSDESEKPSEPIRLNYDILCQKPVSLSWAIDRDLPTLRSDKLKLSIILQNLINNAIKFTDQGSVTVSARMASRNGAVEIEVSDIGMGIPKEALPVIFEKFRRVEGASAQAHGGVGLGLHAAKVFAELLGGSIAVKSEPGQGATFTLLLPVDSRQMKGRQRVNRHSKSPRSRAQGEPGPVILGAWNCRSRIASSDSPRCYFPSRVTARVRRFMVSSVAAGFIEANVSPKI
jgi:anti-sigma regulatory factor (Ser/Thr protein kinase)